MSQFYSNEKLLSTLDKNGQKPELYIVCSRVRGPGKTYSFTKKLFTDWQKNDEKFVLLCRTQRELGSLADGMFKEMLDNEFPGVSVFEKLKMKGIYSEVYATWIENKEEKTEHCGYCIPLNSADPIKKISSMFVDASQGYFDEFQPNRRSTYLPDEVDAFLLVHGSLARGGQKSRRYFPIYMSSNTISVANPYFQALGLTNKIQSNTKFYRGDGFVFEKAENPGLAKQHAESAMSRAFSANKSIDYEDNSWVNDDGACVCKPDGWGRSVYLGSVRCGGAWLGIHLYDNGILYVDYSIEEGADKYCMEPGSEYPIFRLSGLCESLKRQWFRGNVRVRSISIKNMLIDNL